jgi:hypothetical protein
LKFGLAAIEIGEGGSILILLDSEGECPAQLAPELLTRARNARSGTLISVVLAHHEFEAWLLASASSLREVRGFSNGMADHPNPESVPGCKQWLETWLPPTSKYSETADQAALAAAFDMRLARRALSFGKLWREVQGICMHALLLQ